MGKSYDIPEPMVLHVPPREDNQTAVLVLDDGETYAGLEGCTIRLIDADVLTELEAGDVHESDFDEHAEIVVRFTQP